MNKSESIKELSEALVLAQAEMPVALKTSDNPYYNSKYAELADIIKLTRPILSKHNLAISQFPISKGNSAGVETVLLHKSGEFISNEITLIPSGNTPQAMASCITYARRYGWQSVIGLAAEEDDDGNMASDTTDRPETIDNPFDVLENFLLVNQIKDEFILDRLNKDKKKDEQYLSIGDIPEDKIKALFEKRNDILKAWKSK